MKPKRTKDIGKKLQQKGFKREERGHIYFILYYNNKKTSVYTKLSHSIKEYGKPLLNQIAHQLSLTNEQLDKFLSCPLTHDDLVKILVDKGRIRIEK